MWSPSRGAVCDARAAGGSFVLAIALGLLGSGCATSGELRPGAPPARASTTRARGAASGSDGVALREQTGLASWYSDSLAGHATASGRAYDPARRTAAHRALAFGTVVRVTRTDTGRQVEVVINDRGPFGDARRVIDLSRAAAQALDMLSAGVVPVRLEVLQSPAR